MDLVNLIYSENSSSNLTKFKFSLTKAQKLLTKLKLYIDKNKAIELSENLYFYLINNKNLPLQNDNEFIINNINNKNKELVEKNNNFNLINFDYVKLKSTVYSKNSSSKLDEILSYVDYLNKLKNTYDSYLHKYESLQILENLSDKDLEFIRQKDSLQKNDYYDLQSFNLTCFKKDKLKEIIKNINKKLDELENRRDYINSTTEIEVEFNQVTVDLLGL